MTSKKRGKKFKPKAKINEETNNNNEFMIIKENIFTFFTTAEIAQIKNILNIKDATSVSISLGCVILNKFDNFKEFIEKNGNEDVNEIGPNNQTALQWAVKNKYFNFVHYLLEIGANPTLKLENCENILIIALEHKLWDENSFINFWQIINNNKAKKNYSIDFNVTNKNGHTILHIAVRREWEKFIEILLQEKVDLNITNINGVTPLMTACYRNNLNIVKLLINNGAHVTKEDIHFRTALCYAIVTEAKLSSPPFKIAEKIIFELKKDLSFKEYIKRRIEIIELFLNKERISEVTCEMFIILIRYLVQFTEYGLKILLELNMFQILYKALKKFQTNNDDKKKFLLKLLLELLFYNEPVLGFNLQIQQKLANQFYSSNIMKMFFLDILQNSHLPHFNVTFYILINFCTLNEIGQKWFKENFEEINRIFKSLPVDFAANFQKDFNDEKQLKLIKNKMRKFRRLINNHNNNTIINISEDAKELIEKTTEPLSNKKKPKRKLKSMNKTKTVNSTKKKNFDLHHLKNEDLVEEFAPEFNSLTNKMKQSNAKINNNNDEQKNNEENNEELIVEDSTADLPSDNEFSVFDEEVLKEIEENEKMLKTFMSDELFIPPIIEINDELENPISQSLKQFLETHQPEDAKNLNKIEHPEDGNFPDWKTKIQKLPFNEWSQFCDKIRINKPSIQAAMQFIKKFKSNNNNGEKNRTCLEEAVNVVINYLKELLRVIIARTKSECWELTHENKPCKIDNKILIELQTLFYSKINSITCSMHSDINATITNIYQLESTLLHFPIEDEKILLAEICAFEEVKIRYKTYTKDAENSLLKYIENALNGTSDDLHEDLKISIVEPSAASDEELNYFSSMLLENAPQDLYAEETQLLTVKKPQNKRKALEAKIKTMENSYHLIESIEKLIEDDDEKVQEKKNSELFNTNNNNSDRKSAYADANFLDILSRILTKHIGNDKFKSRWSEKIIFLKANKQIKILFGGNLKLCKFPTEKSHVNVISQGGNFNIVTLGLNSNDEPLAVKKIPSEHCVCKLLKNLINPLLGLRNKHILHYFICDYQENELFLVTPLCEYNIGQYVLLLNECENKNIFNLTQMEIVKQFLTGLEFLHKLHIVHGNLKPSNIFVDINGIVRLAEFGINKALFKLVEAPKTSLIWFSQECYQLYKKISTVECSLSSDVQVAGMLIYFIISGGDHPFGSEVCTILKNLEKSTFNALPSLLRNIQDQNFLDILTWMLMYQPNDRPTIKQVLSLSYFS